MSALALLVHRVADLHPAALEPLLGRMRHRGPDGADVRVGGSGAIGHLHFWTTPEERGERQPVAIPDRRAWLAFDGRLDDRDALRRAVGGERRASDAALVAAGFAKWGRDLFRRLEGPFAIAIWDADGRQAWLARDPVGSRAIAYFADDRRFAAASEPAALVALAARGGLDPDLDEERIAAYFSLEDPEPSQTFFRAIRELEPGSFLRLAPQGIERATFSTLADFAPSPALLRASERTRAEAFSCALDQAVRRRLRAITEPGVMLSGGLDSSPIAALAAGAFGRRRRVRAYSWTFERHPRADERAHVAAMTRAFGLELEPIPCDDAPPLADLNAWPVHPATPEQNAYRLFHERTYRAAAGDGARVLLSGMCGDQLYAGAEGWLRDLLGERRLRDAAVAIAAHLRGVDDGPRWRATLGALLPPALRLERAARRAGARMPWLTERALALLPDPSVRDASALRYRRPDQAALLLSAQNGHGFSVERFYADAHGVELRYPLRDARVLALALALPTRDLYHRGLRRPLLRRAFAGRLPASVLERRDKATFEDLFFEGVYGRAGGEVAALLFRPEALWSEFVDRERVAVAWRERQAGLGGLLVWLAIQFELWLARRPWRDARGAVGQQEFSIAEPATVLAANAVTHSRPVQESSC